MKIAVGRFAQKVDLVSTTMQGMYIALSHVCTVLQGFG